LLPASLPQSGRQDSLFFGEPPELLFRSVSWRKDFPACGRSALETLVSGRALVESVDPCSVLTPRARFCLRVLFCSRILSVLTGLNTGHRQDPCFRVARCLALSRFAAQSGSRLSPFSARDFPPGRLSASGSACSQSAERTAGRSLADSDLHLPVTRFQLSFVSAAVKFCAQGLVFACHSCFLPEAFAAASPLVSGVPV
jgi:hypothetical protein